MGRQVQLNWQVLLAEDEWNREETPAIPAPSAAPIQVRPDERTPVLWAAAVLLTAVAVCAGVWLWREARSGVAQIEAELAESITLAGWLDGNPDLDVTIQEMVLRGEQALVQVHVADPHLPFPYRQTRFYRRLDGGWLPTGPDAGFWGEAATLESTYFVFSFFHRDQASVAAAAPVLDAHFQQMRRTLGLPEATADAKIPVQVALQAPEAQADQGATQPLQVVSPRLLPVPQTLADADVLVRAILVPLNRLLIDETLQEVPIHRRWRLLGAPRRALAVWSLWDSGGPMAMWRPGLVRWQYTAPTALPDGYEGLCQFSALFALTPLDSGAALSCSPLDRRRGRPPAPATRLSQLLPVRPVSVVKDGAIVLAAGYPEAMAGHIRTIPLATLFEYVVETYGRERLPYLLTALSEADSWETIAPRVFGVSARELERGWHTYLAEAYGVDVAHNSVGIEP